MVMLLKQAVFCCFLLLLLLLMKFIGRKIRRGSKCCQLVTWYFAIFDASCAAYCC